VILTICRAIFAVQRTRSEIADLITSDPAGWEVDEFHMTHARTGIRVWIANEAYGCHYDLADHAPLVGPTWNLKWERITPSFAERRIIWAAAKDSIRSRKIAAEKARLRRIKNRLRRLHDDGDAS